MATVTAEKTGTTIANANTNGASAGVEDDGVISFEDVSLDDLVATRGPRTNTFVARIIEQFLNTGRYAASPRMPEGEANAKRAHNILAYARQYGKPIRAMFRDGKIILKRVDMTEQGTAIPNWETSEEYLGSESRRAAAKKAGETRKAANASKAGA